MQDPSHPIVLPPDSGDAGPPPAAPVKPAGFWFVFLTVVLDMLAIGIIVPVLPNLVKEMAGGSFEEAARWIGLFSASWATMQFLFMPLLGALSDTYGRKGIFLFSNFGQAVACALTALAPGFLVLFLARLVSGAVSGSVSTAYAYVADISAPEQRAARFGQLGAAFGLGFTLGPAIGGQLAQIDIHLPFWAAAAMAFANGIYGLLVLPESLPRERRVPFVWTKANPVASLSFLARNPQLSGLATIKAIVDLAHASLPSTFVLYGLYRYGWAEDMTGLTLTMVGITQMLVQGGLVGPVIKAVGERVGLLIGMATAIIAYFGYGLAPLGWLFWLVIPIAAFNGLINPSLQSLMTRRVSPSEQGRLQGAIGTVQAAMGVIGPLIFTAVFAWGVDDARAASLPGAPLYLAGALAVIAGILAVIFSRTPHMAASRAPHG